MGQAQAGEGKFVEVGRMDFAAEGAEVENPRVIGSDQEKVRALLMVAREGKGDGGCLVQLGPLPYQPATAFGEYLSCLCDMVHAVKPGAAREFLRVSKINSARPTNHLQRQAAQLQASRWPAKSLPACR